MGIAEEVVALERAALQRWGHGDVDGFLALSAPDVVYFDPFVESAIVGLEALARHYEPLRGKIRIVEAQFLEPHVQELGDVAVLTFRFHSRDDGGQTHRWKTTEVYRRTAEGLRIVHTHWAFER